MALPFVTVSSAAYDKLIEKEFFLTEKAGKLDGYLVAPHGATVSEKYPYADGHWLYKLRRKVRKTFSWQEAGQGNPRLSFAYSATSLSKYVWISTLRSRCMICSVGYFFGFQSSFSI
tara:strand:- start:1199 stop:1549 length:351 start_codon:yes stop_codon:yes gene_type:complete